MSEAGIKDTTPPKKSLFNMSLVAVAGQVGCLTTVLVVGSLLLGLWLDNLLGTKPIFMIVLLVGSVPVTVVMMLWIVRRVTTRIAENSEQTQPAVQESNSVQEE